LRRVRRSRACPHFSALERDAKEEFSRFKGPTGLDKEQFGRMMKTHSGDASEDAVGAVYASADTDGDSLLSEEEVVAFYVKNGKDFKKVFKEQSRGCCGVL
jgi:Ca2+-binding EF-hand superfamily protein